MDADKQVSNLAGLTIIGIFSIYFLHYFLQAIIPREEIPIEYPEPYGIFYLSPAGHIMNVSYGEGEEPEYFGEAMPGTSDDEAGWRIYRYEYSMIGGDLEVTKIRFASGNTSFDKIWDDREDYEYS